MSLLGCAHQGAPRPHRRAARPWRGPLHADGGVAHPFPFPAFRLLTPDVTRLGLRADT